MDKLTRNLRRSTMGFVKAAPVIVEALDENTNFCAICRDTFQINDIITLLGCCKVQYHVECVSKWFNTTPLHPGGNRNRTIWVTCMLCKGRWNKAMFNAFVPPANIAAFTRRSHQRAGKHWFGHIEAGAPPSDSSIVDAAGGYGRYGVQVVLSEILGVSHAPVKAEDVPLLMEELMERMQERLGNNRQI